MLGVRDFINSAPVDSRLEFGYAENIIISAITTDPIKDSNGNVSKQIEISLSKIDPVTRKILATSTGSFWKLRNDEKFYGSYERMISSLLVICKILDVELDEFYNECLINIPLDVDEKSWLLGKKKDSDVDALQDSIVAAVKKLLVPKVPTKDLFKCKVLFNSKGFFELGTVDNWIVKMDGDTEVTPYTHSEIAQYKESITAANKKEIPDQTGKPPASSDEKTVENVSQLDI